MRVTRQRAPLADTADCFKRTPLVYAACANFTDQARLLLQHSADVNAPDCLGRTPLHFAAAMGHTESVGLLLQHKADAALVDQHQNTSVHYAASEAREGPLTELLRSPRGQQCLRVRNLDDLVPLLGPDTAVVPAVNGLPWWYFHKAQTGTTLDEKPLQAVDPGGRVWNEIGPQRAIGCVVYPACEIAAPGLVKHLDGDRFTLGEPSMEQSERVKTLSSLMIAGDHQR